MITAQLIINSEYRNSSSSQTQEIYSPADNSVLGNIALATRDDVDIAFQSATDAFASWKNTTIEDRCKIMKAIAEDLYAEQNRLAELLCDEVAKPYKSALDEIARSAEFIYATSDIAKSVLSKGEILRGDIMNGYKSHQKTAIVEKSPIGVIVCISPFNYPVNLAISKIIPAIIAGNTVVFKPATQGSLVGFEMAKMIASKLPKGVLNFITGKSSEIGDHITSHKLADFVNFTGSTGVGRHIMEILNSNLSRKSFNDAILELGGKDFAIVTKSANMDKVVKHIMKGAFSFSGQRCTAVKGVLADASIHAELIRRLEIEVSKLRVGMPKDENVDITPLIDAGAAKYAKELFNNAKENGMRDSFHYAENGNLVCPNLLWFDDPYLPRDFGDIRIFSEEQFAPILPIFPFTDLDEAINLVNNLDYGLQTDIFTQDIDEAFSTSRALNAGSVQINAKSDRGPDNFPFLGSKMSGFGVQGIESTLEAMVRKQVIIVNL